MLRTIISIWRDFSSQMKKQNISAYASSTAFFLFLSVIPMLMVVCAVIPYTPVTEQNLITALTDVTPDIADAMVESLVVDVYESSVGILPVALIAMVWSAAKGVMALMRGLNAVNGVDEKFYSLPHREDAGENRIQSADLCVYQQKISFYPGKTGRPGTGGDQIRYRDQGEGTVVPQAGKDARHRQ